MKLDVSAEFRTFTDSVGRYLEKHRDAPEVTHVISGLAALGVCQLAVPESAGGMEISGSETLSLMRTLGYAFAAEPIVNQVFLPARLLAESDSSVARAELNVLADGDKTGALAHDEAGSRYGPGKIQTRAISEGNSYRLNGFKARVIGGDRADFFLVSATLDKTDQFCFFLVQRELPGMEIQALTPHGHCGMAQIHLNDAVVSADSMVLGHDVSLKVLSHIQDYARFLLSAESLGIMDRLIGQTLEHLQARVQFGQPLANFQVLQHRVVDMVIERNRAEALVMQAAHCLDNSDFHEASLYAKYCVGEASRFVGQQAIQLHGGMGLTKELDIGRLYKRLLAINSLHGDTDYIMELLVA